MKTATKTRQEKIDWLVWHYQQSVDMLRDPNWRESWTPSREELEAMSDAEIDDLYESA